jgi:hypothetical protein
MFQELAQLDHGRLGIFLAFAAIALTFLTIVLSIAAVQWRKVRQSEVEAQLKMQMLEQGIAPSDIVQILDAGSQKRRVRKWVELADRWLDQKSLDKSHHRNRC